MKKKVRKIHHPDSKSVEPNQVMLFLQQNYSTPLNEINNLTRQMLTEKRIRKEMEDVWEWDSASNEWRKKKETPQAEGEFENKMLR